MLSSKAKYGVRALTLLAQLAPRAGWVTSGELAERGTIPRKFLEAILVDLRDHGLVESRRGVSGGHKLAVAPDAISLADLIRLFDGPLALSPCASRTRFGPCRDCPETEACTLRHTLLRARDAMAAVLEGCTLDKLAAEPVG